MRVKQSAYWARQHKPSRLVNQLTYFVLVWSLARIQSWCIVHCHSCISKRVFIAHIIISTMLDVLSELSFAFEDSVATLQNRCRCAGIQVYMEMEKVFQRSGGTTPGRLSHIVLFRQPIGFVSFVIGQRRPCNMVTSKLLQSIEKRRRLV